jgi:hypothetical protein
MAWPWNPLAGPRPAHPAPTASTLILVGAPTATTRRRHRFWKGQWTPGRTATGPAILVATPKREGPRLAAVHNLPKSGGPKLLQLHKRHRASLLHRPRTTQSRRSYVLARNAVGTPTKPWPRSVRLEISARPRPGRFCKVKSLIQHWRLAARHPTLILCRGKAVLHLWLLVEAVWTLAVTGQRRTTVTPEAMQNHLLPPPRQPRLRKLPPRWMLDRPTKPTRPPT